MRFGESNKLCATLLVSACYTDLGKQSEKISGYYDHPWEWKKIKENNKIII